MTRRDEFELLFQRDPDPWNFRSSPYEAAKFDATIAALGGRRFASGLDVGCANGVLTARLAAQCDRLLAVDVAQAALDLAAEEMARQGHGHVAFRRADIPDDWPTGRFDLIVSNPPYIAAGEMAGLAPEVRDWEPRLALTDDGDGLGAYRAITAAAPAHLAPGGWLAVEIGPAQGAAVAALFRGAGLSSVTVRPDLDGRDRVVLGQAS